MRVKGSGFKVRVRVEVRVRVRVEVRVRGGVRVRFENRKLHELQY